MTNTYLDNCLPVIAIDVAIEEKTRVARMAAATLHKLHDAMQRMKEWREDSMKLKSSIWRMKMDLRVDDKFGKLEDQVVDPLITHQRAQINHLERTNNDLENQVTNLKDALNKAEGDAVPIREMGDQMIRIEEEFAHERERLNDEILNLRTRLRETEEDQASVTLEHHFKEKLLEYVKGDRTIEIVLANMIGRVVETVVNLSEELVYVNEDLCRFKTKNRHLHLKLDRLRAMLRTRCGGSAEYRKRIDELSNLAARLLGQMDRLKVIREKARHGDIPDVVRQVECLTGDLKNRLRSEHEALIAGGDPDCLRYMKKVVDLRVNLMVLSVELRQSNALVLERPRATVERDHWRTATLLNEFLQRIDLEIGRFRVKPIPRYCRIGGISGARYAAKVAELEGMVKQLIGVIVALKQNSQNSEADDATSGKATEELADSIERLCGKIKDLDIVDDRASLRGRIDQLEGSLMRLKLEVATRDERICALRDDRAVVESSLMRDRELQGEIVADLRAENDSLREDINNKRREISGLSRKRERSAQRATEMLLMKAEIDATKKTLQDHRHDRETLLRETKGVRDILRDREKEIEDIVTERDTLRGRLEAEVMELRSKLEIASDENIKLKSDTVARIGGERPDNRMRDTTAGDERDNDEVARNLRDELERLRAESNESRISLDSLNEQIDRLKRSLNKASLDRTRLEGEIGELRSNEKSLTHRLNLRTSACEAATRESERVAAENKELAVRLKHARKENEQLTAQLSLLRCEKGRIARAMTETDNERVALRRQIDEVTCQLSKLRDDEMVEMTRLRQENTALVSDLKEGSARQSGIEERARLLLTEKNELVTRINEVDAENDALRERLNKAEEENEYFSIELNKSRLENDRVRTRNALLQVTCEKRERDSNDMRKERDHVRVKLHEVGSECRILGNQLAIQRMKYEALRFTAVTLYHENNERTSHLKKIDTRYPLARPRDRGGFATAGNDVKHKRDYSDAARAGINVELGELGDVEFKAESDAHADPDNKDKIKDKPKGDELKSLTNKSLEIADLRSEVCQITDSDQLARTKGELKEPLVMEGPGIEEIINSVLGRHEIVNICYKRETNDYADYHRDDNAMIFAREMNPRWSAMIAIDQLEVENSALKMEMNILRSSLNCSVIDSEKAKTDVARAAEEIQALRLELMNTRDEKAALRSRFEMHKEEVNAFRSERVALKNELAVLRKSNFDLRLKANNNPRAAHENPKNARVANDPEIRNLQETSGDVKEPLVELAT